MFSKELTKSISMMVAGNYNRYPLLMVIISIIAPMGFCFYECEDSFCLPLWSNLKKNSDSVDEDAVISLGRDPESGCLCRQAANQWTVCYGRENCVSFPKNVKIATEFFRIKGSKIYQIKPKDLSNFPHLSRLEIDGNFNFSRIWPGVFSNMTKLEILSISGNPNLKSLENATFSGLDNLKELELIKNGFNSISSISLALNFFDLPKMYKLDLSQNSFADIDRDDFSLMEGSNLRELNLILCQIENIHSEVFAPLTNLKALRLGENSLNITILTQLLNRTIELEIPLELLNLYSIGLRKSPPRELLQVVSQSNVTRLSLARNQFESLTSHSFPRMNNLLVLDLAEVSALNISDDAFVGFPNLKILTLKSNKLSSIPEGALLEQLTYLDLQDNSGNKFAPSYFSLYGRKFRNMKNLKGLDLSYNRINAIYNTTFEGLTNLTTLGLRNSSIYYISPKGFIYLPNLLILNLENNHFPPRNSVDPEIFKGLDKLEVLLLGGCDLNFIGNNENNPFRFVKNLKHLGLERNKLTVIEPEDFKFVTKLKSLDLSQNNLQPWQNPVFFQNPDLKKVDLSNNKISYFTAGMLQDFLNFTEINLSENPLICDCDSFYLYTNYKKTVEILFKNMTVFCSFPEDATNLTYLRYVQTKSPQFCSHIYSKLLILLPSVLFLCFLIISGFLIYYYRSHLRYWIFLTRLYLTRRGSKSSKSQKQGCDNYMYDAFVSYSNEDRNFVIRLVSMLENYHPFLKLCVYERDFEVGTIISDNVLDSVTKSRKTLLVISDSYAKSQWCRWESQIAEHHRLFFRKETGEYVDDGLVLVKLGPVSENHLTPTLKFLLKTRIYLNWDSDEKKQRTFWERLRNVLASPQKDDEEEYTHL